MRGKLPLFTQKHKNIPLKFKDKIRRKYMLQIVLSQNNFVRKKYILKRHYDFYDKSSPFQGIFIYFLKRGTSFQVYMRVIRVGAILLV